MSAIGKFIPKSGAECRIIGGGIAEHMAQFQPYLHTNALVLPASSLNQAGIIGAALFAESQI